MSFGWSVKNSKSASQNTKGVALPSCSQQGVVNYGFPLSSPLLGYGRIICGFKGKASSETKVYGNFLFSLNQRLVLVVESLITCFQ